MPNGAASNKGIDITMNGLGEVVVGIVVIVVVIAIAWFLFSRLYERSSTEVSFVRTGMFGQRVMISGGAIVIPVLHRVIRVNMNTIRLPIRRENERALITQDRMRANVEANFYLRVAADKQSVALAAQTLGSRTMSAEAMIDLVEGKLISALRAIAAEMTMEELHQRRSDFSSRVRDLLADDLSKNGLDVESVSIAQLDQTSREFFNPNNAFDAAGLTKLTEQIEERRRRRNEIEQDTEVAIQLKNLDSERKVLDIRRDEEYARLEQEREIAIRRAQQAAEIATERAARQLDSEQADIHTKEALDRARIAAERAVAAERIEIDKQIRELEIARSRTVEFAEIERRRAVEIAEQEAAIAVAEQEIGRAAAQAEAEAARAAVVKAEETVITARDIERAERDRRLQVIAATAASERQGVAKRGEADTGKYVAAAEGDAIRIRADAEGAAEKLRAAAAEVRYAIEAAGHRQLHEAENTQSAELMNLRLKLATLERLEGIVRESVKPMERIDGIKVVQVDGLMSAAGGAHGGGAAASGNLADQIVNSALRFRGQAPLVDFLLKEVGLNSLELGSLQKLLANREPDRDPVGDDPTQYETN
jgi:uncharacterized membrane protein YqiK